MKSPTAPCSRSGARRCTPGSSTPSSALYPDRLAEHVERLAHHALRGELWEKAVAYLRQAGARAMARSAYREAVALLGAGAWGSRPSPQTRETTELTIDVRLDIRNGSYHLAIGRAHGASPPRGGRARQEAWRPAPTWRSFFPQWEMRCGVSAKTFVRSNSLSEHL